MSEVSVDIKSVRGAVNNDRATGRIVQVCDAVGDFIAWWGFKAIHGRTWTLLALRRDAMTQVEIAATLGVSRSGMSATIGELLSLGLIRPTSGARNAAFEAVIDVWPTIADVLRTREWMLVETARMALEGALEEVQLVEAAGRRSPYDVGRIRMLLGMTEIAQSLLKTLIHMRLPPVLDGLTGWVARATEVVGRIRRGAQS